MRQDNDTIDSAQRDGLSFAFRGGDREAAPVNAEFEVLAVEIDAGHVQAK
jgi:hypothetical protein